MSESTTPPEEAPAPAPVPEQQPAAPPPPEQPAEEGEAQAASPEPPAQQPDWRDRRIATLTRRLKEMQEREAVPPPQQQPQQQDYAKLTQQQIDARARELAMVQDFNRRCDEAALQGRSQFGEGAFNARISNLQKLSDPTDPASVQAYNSMLMAALEAGDAGKLLYDLGADLNEAQRILGLSPTRMAVELTRRAASAPAQVSSAARPIAPLGGRPASHERIEADDPDRADRLSTQEWMRRREAQLSDRRKAN